MSVVRYRVIEPWTEAFVTLDVDHDKLTPKLAHEINKFFSASEDRLALADGDPALAVIRMAGLALLFGVLDPDGPGLHRMREDFNEREGWPPNGEHGIELVNFDGRPELEHDDIQVEKIGPV